jgi:hypothetical protein
MLENMRLSREGEERFIEQKPLDGKPHLRCGTGKSPSLRSE